ncbi:MAG: prepilin-type N-terminal cleavage/methylation domain-containing protein [Actinobacteria bacterium]|nr:prepilin-type N-terminal cleavage/methylation domain-containing protein [Actinomycetota bacterium]
MRARVSGQDGFTIVEVLVAAVVLVVGLGGLLQMLVTADHAISTTRLRQAETSLAREVLEDARGLSSTQLTSAAIASALQSTVPQATVSGSNLVVSRAVSSSGSPTSFNVSFAVCELDNPSDGYGSHSSAPASGGTWCPDVASSGTQDSNPADYTRVSVTVTPSSRSTPTVQQTILVYGRPVNGPAVTCLSTSATCPGPSVTATSGSSLTFNVTTTAVATRIQWLVNGNVPPSEQIPAASTDPYAPSGTSSSFTWNFPTADGTYTIAAVAYDSDGNSGTRSTVVVNLNRHQVIAPTSFSAGWNDLTGGAELQWIPSVDQDVLYYRVYRKYGSNASQLVATCGNVTGTSCADAPEAAFAPPDPSARPNPCTSSAQSYTTTDYYWVVGVDSDPTTRAPRESTAQSPQVDANLCDHQPYAPTTLSGTLANGQLALSWDAPSPAASDSWNSIQAWRVYRWPSNRAVQIPGDRYQLVGNSPAATSYTDGSPDPGGVQQSYCVTAVDTHLNESPCSPVLTQ